jgi:hypothetical protein
MGEQIIIAMTIVAMAIIIGMTLNGIVDKVIQAKRLRYEAQAKADPQGQDIRAIADRTQMIEDRLRVLERIATDRGSVLADEIEALRRDMPALVPAQRQIEDAVK